MKGKSSRYKIEKLHFALTSSNQNICEIYHHHFTPYLSSSPHLHVLSEQGNIFHPKRRPSSTGLNVWYA